MLDVSIKLEFLGLSNIKDYKEYELEIMMLYEIVEKCMNEYYVINNYNIYIEKKAKRNNIIVEIEDIEGNIYTLNSYAKDTKTYRRYETFMKVYYLVKELIRKYEDKFNANDERLDNIVYFVA